MEHAIHHLATDLNISEPQAAALILKVRQSFWKSLCDGFAVDMGFCYLKPGTSRARRRHDFGVGRTITAPPSPKFDILIPPVVKQALQSDSFELPQEVWMTRGQLKRALKERGEVGTSTYYHLKGVTV